MKCCAKVARLLAVAFLAASAVANSQHASVNHSDGRMSISERSYLVASLTSTRNELLSSIHGLTPAEWNFKEAPDRWSIEECAEHLILAEGVLFADVQRIMHTADVPRPVTSDSAHDRALVASVMDRSAKAKAPAVITPHGTFATPELAAAAFTKLRDRTINYARFTKEPLRTHVGDGPTGGTDDAYQILLIMAAHTGRHTLQIREIKDNPGYPKPCASPKSC